MKQFSDQCIVLNRLFDFQLESTAQYNIEFQFTTYYFKALIKMKQNVPKIIIFLT